MNQLFDILSYSRQAQSQMENRMESRKQRAEAVLSQAKEYRRQYARVGSRRLYYMAGITAVGINQFEELMSGAGLTVQRLRRRIITTESKGYKHIYPNLLIDGYKLSDVNELVVCDLTYFQNESGLYYICLITDVYSQRIVGAEPSTDKRTIHASKALHQLVDLRGADSMECTIHHGDKGSEYRSDSYIGELISLKMQISMASNCLENGYAERRNGTIKNDFLLYSETSINNICQLRKALRIAVYRYNHEVVQAKLGYRTPVMYEAWIASLPPDQRPVKEIFNFNKKDK
jgi:putative transposase